VSPTDELLDAMADRGADGSAVEFMYDFAYLLPVTVICELIGIPEADRERFRPIARDLAGVFELGDAEALPGMNAAAAQALDYFTELAARRRADPRDDLVTDLLAISDSDDGRLSGPELMHNLTMLMVVGFETATGMLGNGLQIVLQHPSAVRASGTGRCRRPRSWRKCCVSIRPSSTPIGSVTTRAWAVCRCPGRPG
jgi:cytochrome P450